MSDLRGCVAVVSGASSGIGRATCAKLVSEGMVVVGAARREDRLQSLREALGDRFVPVVADLRSEDDILRIFSAAEGLGPLKVVVNNAGLGRDGTLHDGRTEDWREMLEVNVLALAIATREGLARFGPDGGHVVHISSMSGYRVPAGSGMYAATKHAVKALTEGLRKELRAKGSMSRVTAISPGNVRTEFVAVATGDWSVLDEPEPFPLLTAEDIAASVWFAVSAPPHMEVHDILLRPRDQRS